MDEPWLVISAVSIAIGAICIGCASLFCVLINHLFIEDQDED